MLGYTREELLRMCVSDIHPQNELPRIQECFDAMGAVKSIAWLTCHACVATEPFVTPISSPRTRPIKGKIA